MSHHLFFFFIFFFFFPLPFRFPPNHWIWTMTFNNGRTEGDGRKWGKKGFWVWVMSCYNFISNLQFDMLSVTKYIYIYIYIYIILLKTEFVCPNLVRIWWKIHILHHPIRNCHINILLKIQYIILHLITSQ